MDKKIVFALAIGVAVGISGSAAAFVVYSALFGVLISPQDCPLEFGVAPLNTTYGWFYQVTYQKTEPKPLVEYAVRLFIFGPPDYYGNQAEIVDFEGPLPSLVGASGNFSFEDRGIHPGKLDNSGDYFWAAEWHNLSVYRSANLVGGTVACG